MIGRVQWVGPMSAYGGKADVIADLPACLLIATSGHSLVRRVLLGMLGPDRVGAGLQLRRLGAASGLTKQGGERRFLGAGGIIAPGRVPI